ncbi:MULTISPECIES: hypothetical protein [Pantoea]|uniref:hypothetical protein n=1 Tax=Pantoea TaxID=53335 RepID=UPI0028B06E19|nr:hypothetical protein [Pantoea vagans]
MPIVVTFDLTGYKKNDHGKLKTMFEKFGWENLGGTAYRYPKLGTSDQPVEDWLNHVIPALMLFRAYLSTRKGVTLERMSIDTSSSSGYNPDSSFGHPVLPAKQAANYKCKGQSKFGQKLLEKWLNNIQFPYP